jgi:hypothetical protein
MFSKEITDLLKDDNFEVLKLLSQYNPERFKNDVHALSENGNSFFINLMAHNRQLNYVKKLLELCESFGYNFVDAKRPYHEDDVYKIQDPRYTKDTYNYGKNFPLNLKNPEFTPEYITAFSYIRNDETFAFLTEKMGKERMLQLEKDGWPILEYAYRKEFYKTIHLLCDYGFDYDNTPSGISIISIAENDSKLLDLYWKIKNQKDNNKLQVMGEQQFLDFYGFYEKNIKEVVSKKNYRAEQIIKLLDEKKDILTKEQKEKLLIRSLPAVDDRIFKALAKMLNYKQRGPELTNLVLNNLELAHKHQLLYWVVEDDNLLFNHIKKNYVEKKLDDEQVVITYEPLKDIYGIDKIIEKCSSLNIRPGYAYESDKQKKMVNDTFLGRFQKLFENQNTLFKKFDNGLSLFDKIILNRLSKENLLQFVDIKPMKSSNAKNSVFKTLDEETFSLIKEGKLEFSQEQKYEIKEILNKTWYKNNNLYQINLLNILDNQFFLFDERIMREKDIYTNEHKLAMFNTLVENYWHKEFLSKPIESWKEKIRNTSGSAEVLRDLYFILSDDLETKWSNLVLSDEAVKNLKDSEFLYELRARQLSEELQENKSKLVKSKLKL